MSFAFTPERAKRAEELLALYPDRRAALLPLIWLAQEQEGWVSTDAVAFVAKFIGISEAEVCEAASFYTLFMRRPVGRCHLQLCAGPCCMLGGAGELRQYIEKRLGISAGETTPDGKFSFSTVECLGSCGTAPMMQIGDDYYEGLSEERVDEILESFR